MPRVASETEREKIRILSRIPRAAGIIFVSFFLTRSGSVQEEVKMKNPRPSGFRFVTYY